MIYLGKFKAGDTVFYAANFHNDTGTIENPTALEAQIRNAAGTWSALTAPAQQNSKTGHYGGTIDTTGFTAGQHIIRMQGTVATAKIVATEFSFLIVANLEADVKGDTAAIKVKTDNLPSDPASETTLAIIAGYIDTEITTLLNRIGAFTGTGVNTVLGFLKAVMSKAASTPSDVGGTFDPATDSVEAVSEATTSLGALLLSGSNGVTLTIYEHGTTTPIQDYDVTFRNSDESVNMGTIRTNALGQITVNLAAGTYKLRGRKTGYAADNAVETLVVSTNPTTATYYATPQSIGVPSASNTCRVYEWCFQPDGVTPMTSVTESVYISSLPFDYQGKLHAGTKITPVYDAASGKIYWDLPWTATISLDMPDLFGGAVKRFVVPSLSTQRLAGVTFL